MFYFYILFVTGFDQTILWQIASGLHHKIEIQKTPHTSPLLIPEFESQTRRPSNKIGNWNKYTQCSMLMVKLYCFHRNSWK